MTAERAAFTNARGPERNFPIKKHTIERIEYRSGIKPSEYHTAPMKCSCGWEGTSGEWDEHRRTG